jgi:hypothetical protein
LRGHTSSDGTARGAVLQDLSSACGSEAPILARSRWTL